jgi:uncharacterized protein (DUF1499 family)
MKNLLWLLLAAPPLLDPPGWWPRLRIYLTSNVAETARGHALPELRLAVFDAPPEQLRERVLREMRELGWRQVREDGRRVRAEVVTPLLRFTDDVEARVEPFRQGSVLHLRAASRVGKADFAANQRHLQDLLEALQPDSRL